MNRYRSALVAVGLSLALLCALGVSTGVLPGAAARGSPNVASVPVLSIQPATRQTSPGFVFTVTLVISGATSLGAYETTLLYDPALLQILAVTHPSPGFLEVNGRTAGAPPAEPIKDLVNGRLTLGEYSSGSATSGANGNGTLATLRFQALATGTSTLTFRRSAAYPTELLDPFGNPIPGSSQDGSVTIVPPKKLYLPVVVR
jgi:hypothetical protein